MLCLTSGNTWKQKRSIVSGNTSSQHQPWLSFYHLYFHLPPATVFCGIIFLSQLWAYSCWGAWNQWVFTHFFFISNLSDVQCLALGGCWTRVQWTNEGTSCDVCIWSTTLWGHILQLCFHLAENLKCLLKEADYVGDVKASVCCGLTGRSKIILKQPT